jgi:hypothetical protein
MRRHITVVGLYFLVVFSRRLSTYLGMYICTHIPPDAFPPWQAYRPLWTPYVLLFMYSIQMTVKKYFHILAQFGSVRSECSCNLRRRQEGTEDNIARLQNIHKVHLFEANA